MTQLSEKVMHHIGYYYPLIFQESIREEIKNSSSHLKILPLYFYANAKVLEKCCKDIQLYTYRSDKIVNDAIRYNNMTYHAKKLYKILMNAFKKSLPTPQTITIYRGVGNEYANKLKSLYVGDADTFILTGFSSFSLSDRVAKSYGKIIIIIELPQGSHILNFNQNTTKYLNEAEVLLQPNVTVQIDSKYRDNDYQYIKCSISKK